MLRCENGGMGAIVGLRDGQRTSANKIIQSDGDRFYVGEKVTPK